MKKLTLAEAARLAGVDRSTIFRAIERGRLSATLNKQKKRVIDPAELERVYDLRGDASAVIGAPVNSRARNTRNTDASLKPALDAAQREVGRLEKECVKLREELAEKRTEYRLELADLKAELKELKSELAAERNEVRSLHSRLAPKQIEGPISGLFTRLFGSST